jgi:hypothetical protein
MGNASSSDEEEKLASKFSGMGVSKSRDQQESTARTAQKVAGTAAVVGE